MKKLNKFSINKKMTIYMVGLIIVPLIIIGIFLMEIIYKQELGINCRNYQGKMQWTVSQVDSAFLDGENIALTFYLDDSVQEFLKEKRLNSILEKKVANLMIEQTSNKDWYKSICLNIDEKIMKQWSGGTILEKDNIEYLEQAYQGNRHGFWTLPRILENTLNFGTIYDDYVLTFYGKVCDYYYIHDVLGIVSVSISEEYISQICEGNIGIKNGKHMLLYPDGTILSSNDKTYFGQTYEQYNKWKDKMTEDEGIISTRINGKTNMIFYEKSEEYDWYLVSIVPVTSLTYENVLSIYIIIVGVVLCIIFGICFGMIQKKTVIQPLISLSDKMRHLHSEELNMENEEIPKDEIEMLYKAFRKMEYNIEEMIQKNYISEIYRKDAEIQMLISQINPHFLYNTLDSIYWQAIQNKDYIVAEQIVSLSDIFRHTLKTGNRFVTLQEEINFIEKYVDLMRVQISNEFEFMVEIEKELMSLYIPKLLLQPLVENIFIHGIKEKKGYSGIIILAEVIEENLYLTVSDDGVGGDEETVREELKNADKSNNAFALKNVNQRIKLMFGEKYGLEFHSTVGVGTTVILILPKLENVHEVGEFNI